MTLGSLCKKQDGGLIKIFETFSGNSLKEDLSIDTTFDPCYFSWDSPFNLKFFSSINMFYHFLPLYSGFLKSPALTFTTILLLKYEKVKITFR